MDSVVKQEVPECNHPLPSLNDRLPELLSNNMIDSSSSGSSDIDDPNDAALPCDLLAPAWPLVKFEEPLPVTEASPVSAIYPVNMVVDGREAISPVVGGCKQFWKAGDYDISEGGDAALTTSVGMDHVRVHPKFLHSNATSHKWALGAFAELLDNSLDEVCNGATYVLVDVLGNEKDGTKMLLIEDNGGGMTPDKMRQCMSLGYSVKSKIANTIGQYGNGFKTSTMRLGADVIVFSRCLGSDGQSLTQSIGMLSYTFLRGTRKEDIVVPMIDYEHRGQQWNKMIRFSQNDWNRNLATIVQWSPYESEEDLLKQFDFLNHHGTRIIIYNLWDDDGGSLELDLDTDQHDIQLKGNNRDEKSIQMAKRYPNSRHFLTYRHSLRSYASILYLRLPSNFRIILRGEDVQHHSIVNDMMLSQKITYKPQYNPEIMPGASNMVADVTIGFVKDAKYHIDVQGFNVYHKNRLIKPFWRVWNAAGSDGRGVIGVLEANFVEPAHDKQGFERTVVLSRLEQRLLLMQKNFWSTNCQEIGYAPRRRPDKEALESKRRKSTSGTNKRSRPRDRAIEGGVLREASLPSGSKVAAINEVRHVTPDSNSDIVIKLDEDDNESGKRLMKLQVTELLSNLQQEREKCKALEIQLQEKQQQIEELDKEQVALVDMISEERGRRDALEEKLRKSLKDASTTIDFLLDKVNRLEQGRKD
ncbi:protein MICRORCHIDIA 7-like [Carya illinoinensis]|uniref:Morc S5 domain-containing protein n=1 Tax=Carya illinoinensis TaxID=32201 RepID=A0A8T1QHI9_CARIL|nr:protein MICRORCHIDIA 7-like [Carya illinoinensis]KAG6653855.1 hypothetical protein CIPAW_05G105600 [Carya illinoinensis]KAG6712427.1 hypothetical protein I3842_05G103100 [Carya illinoinensis]